MKLLYPHLAGIDRLTLFNRLFLQSHGDKFFVLGDANEDNGTNYTRIINVVNIGQWDATGDSVIWNRVSVEPDFATTGGLPDGEAYPALAMDDNGTNGYLVFAGRNPDADDPLSYQPFIYQTNDGGNTWTKIAFNWNTIPISRSCCKFCKCWSKSSIFWFSYWGYFTKMVIYICLLCHKAWSNSADSLGYIVDVKYMNGCIWYSSNLYWMGSTL